MTDDQKITIDGAEYSLTDMTEQAKTQLKNVQVTDQELERLQNQTAIAQTARATYAAALKNALENNAVDGS